MTLHWLTIFVAVAKHLNLRKVSQELHISQPSVSQQLRLLEEDVGAKLHTKAGRGIELTTEGRLFLEDAEAILLLVDRARKKFGKKFVGVGKEESLTVGGTYGPSAILLPSVLATFKRKYPNVHVRLLTGSNRSVEAKVAAGLVEIAVVSRLSPPLLLDWEPYATMKMVAFVDADHPMAKKKKWSLSDMAKIPLIIRGARRARSTTEAILKQLSDIGFQPNIAMRCDSGDAVKMAVRRRLGVGILYHDVVRFELRGGEFRLIKVPELNMEGKLFIVYPRGEALSAHARNFLMLLRQAPRKDPLG